MVIDIEQNCLERIASHVCFLENIEGKTVGLGDLTLPDSTDYLDATWLQSCFKTSSSKKGSLFIPFFNIVCPPSTYRFYRNMLSGARGLGRHTHCPQSSIIR